MIEIDLTSIGRDEVVEIYLQIESALVKAKKALKNLKKKHPNNNELWVSQEENIERLEKNERALRKYIIKHFKKDPRTLN